MDIDNSEQTPTMDKSVKSFASKSVLCTYASIDRQLQTMVKFYGDRAVHTSRIQLYIEAIPPDVSMRDRM